MHGKCMVSTPTISTPTISTCFTFPTLSNTNLPLPGGAGGGQDQADLEEEAGGISARGDLLHPLTILCLFTILGGDWARYTLLRHYAYHHVIAHHAPPSRHHVITSSRRAPRLSPAPHRTTLPQSIHTLSLSHPRRGKVTASLLTYLGTTYSPTYSPTYEQARHPARQRHADGSLPAGVNWRSSEPSRSPAYSSASRSPVYGSASCSPAHSSPMVERRRALAEQGAVLGQADTFDYVRKSNKSGCFKSGFGSRQSRGDLFGRNRREVEYEKKCQEAARIIQFYTKPFIVRQTTRAINALLMRTADTPPTDGCGGSCFTRTVGSSYRSPMGAPAYRGVGKSECAVSSGRYVSKYSSKST